jgi:outer membrane lipoprotein SlyB
MRACFAAAVAARLVALALAFAAASCAPVAPVPATGTSAAAIGAATVLAVRPIAPAAGSEAGGWRAALLNGAGESSGPAPAAASLAEFIVRVDDGATLSIVQANADALRVGDRVTLARPAAAIGSPRLVRPL